MTAEFTDGREDGSGPGAELTYRLLMRNKRTVWAVAAIAVVLVLTGAGIAVAWPPGPARPPAAAPGVAPSVVPTSASPTPPAGSDITGPLDLLILGIDTRSSIPDWEPHSDAIMLLHVDESLESGYLFSLPRDLRVEIPAFPRAGFTGGRYKITEAMSRGSRVPGSDKPNPSRGTRCSGKPSPTTPGSTPSTPGRCSPSTG
jgi:anionic cell wall polymer biosynthesis LytR-Cps2A-Psr (LCP) family protein